MSRAKVLALLAILFLSAGVLAQTTQQASMTVTPTTLDFGSVVVNRQNQVFQLLTFKIKNTGDVELLLQIEGPSTPFSITSGTVNRLNPDQEVTISVRFQPVTGGKFSDAIVFRATNVNRLSAAVILKGQGNEPAMGLDTNLLDYGAVKATNNTVGTQLTSVQLSQAKTQTFKITNQGQATLSGDLIFTSDAFFLQNSSQSTRINTGMQQYTSSFTLTKGQTATVTIGFLPLKAGNYSATITIRSNDPKRPSQTVQLKGVGTSPKLRMDRTTISFKDVVIKSGGTAVSESTEMLTFENAGNEILSLKTESPCSEFTVSTTTGISGSTSVNLSSIDPGVKVKIQIKFKPTFIGSFECVLLVYSNDPEIPASRILMKGKGISSNAQTNALPATGQAGLQVSASWTGLLLKANGAASSMQLFVYDGQGRMVYDSGAVNGGTLRWQATNSQGASLANGVYFYRVIHRALNGEVRTSKVEKVAILR